MDGVEKKLREQLVKVAQLLWNAGLVTGTDGNISARLPNANKCLLKPTGFRFCDLRPENFTVIDIKTREVVSGDFPPSLELPFHVALYNARADVGGIVHTHSYYATLFSIVGMDLIPMGMACYTAPLLAKGIGIAKYALPHTEQLALNVVEAIKDKNAVLLPHHGVLTVGNDVEEAGVTAKGVEDLAKLQYDVIQIGTSQPLPDSTLRLILEEYQKKEL